MTRVGEGMQVPCTLHFKGHKKFIDYMLVPQLELECHIFSNAKKKTEYTAASKYIQCFGLQY